MNKIYEQAKDLHVVATYVYGGEDRMAYKNPECTIKYTPSELKEVFVKGAVIIDVNNSNGSLLSNVDYTFMPINFYINEDETAANISYIINDTGEGNYVTLSATI